MPRIKEFENDEYDPIAAEVVRAAAYVGREAEGAPRPAPDPAPSSAPRRRLRRRKRVVPAPPSNGALAGGTPARAARAPSISFERSEKATSEVVRTLTEDRDRALAELRSLQHLRRGEVTALEHTIGTLESEVSHLRSAAQDAAQEADLLRLQLRWARTVSIGATVVLFLLTSWLVFVMGIGS